MLLFSDMAEKKAWASIITVELQLHQKDVNVHDTVTVIWEDGNRVKNSLGHGAAELCKVDRATYTWGDDCLWKLIMLQYVVGTPCRELPWTNSGSSFCWRCRCSSVINSNPRPLPSTTMTTHHPCLGLIGGTPCSFQRSHPEINTDVLHVTSRSTNR